MIQNEIIELLYRHIMRNIVHQINECGDFGVMTDEGRNSSNTELLSSAVRQCNERLECNGHWLGYQALDNIKNDTVFKGLKVRILFCVFFLLCVLG